MFSLRFLKFSPALRTVSQVPKPSSLRLPARRQQFLELSPSYRVLRNYHRPPRPPPPPPPRQSARVVHYRWDPEGPTRAKPLITVQQVGNGIRSPTFRNICIFAVGSSVIFYLINLETVPISGRRRFNCVSDRSVEKQGEILYRRVIEEASAAGAILHPSDPRSRVVQRVMSRLIPASGLEHVDWKVYVIGSQEKNAFVIPGGKVFVFTGILPICANDDGLATVLGHEIAHNVARHGAETMSSLIMLAPIRWALVFLDMTGFTLGLGRVLGDFALELGISRPASRKQESEADYMGLMMMAKACYDPSAAVKVWERMEEANRDEVPQWLSTHPSNSHRIDQMKSWLPEAYEERQRSECAGTDMYAKEYQTFLGGLRRERVYS